MNGETLSNGKMPGYVRLIEVVMVLRLPRAKIRRLMEAGEFVEPSNIGGVLLFSSEEVQNWASENLRRHDPVPGNTMREYMAFEAHGEIPRWVDDELVAEELRVAQCEEDVEAAIRGTTEARQQLEEAERLETSLRDLLAAHKNAAMDLRAERNRAGETQGKKAVA